MAAKTETAAASNVSQRLGRVSAGSAAIGTASSFADILQVSLQESAASLNHAARTLVGETKTPVKGATKKSDSTDASSSAPGTSPQTMPLPITAPAAVLVPMQTTASPANFRSNFDLALNDEPLEGAAATTQNAQTSVAGNANSSNASQTTTSSWNASPTAREAGGTDSNSSSLRTIESQHSVAPATWANLPVTDSVQTKNSEGADFPGENLIGQSSAATGSEIPNELSNASNSSSNGAPAALPDKQSVSSTSASDSTAMNAVSAQLNTLVVGTTSDADAVPVKQPPAPATVPIDGNDSSADASGPQTPGEAPAQSGGIAASNASAPSADVAISFQPQSATTGMPANSLQSSNSGSANTLPLADKNARKQTANAGSDSGVHSFTQTGNALSTPAFHGAHIVAEAKHSQSGSVVSGATLPTQVPAPAISAPQAQSAPNSENPAAQNTQASTTAQGQQSVGPDAANTTQTNGTVGAQVPSQFNPPTTTSKHDTKSDKVTAVSTSSETAASTPLNATATTPTAASTQSSDAGAFAKPAVSAPGATPSHPPSANSSATQILDDGPELSPAMHAWNGGANLQANLTGTPHVVEKLSQSEMNIAMQADALGAVQVRAHMAGDQVGAAITVEHHDVHAMLANDLSSLHQALAEKQLRVENLSVQQGYFPGGGGTSDGKSGQQQPQQGTTQRGYPIADAQPRFSSEPIFSTSTDSSESRGSFDSQGRLSVRA